MGTKMVFSGAVEKTLMRCEFIRRVHSSATGPRVLPPNTYYRYKRNVPKGIQQQKFQFFLVLDFEATCDQPNIPDMEIIEFPCLKVDAQTFQVLNVFHEYVRPVKNPTLSGFCSHLTGITQEMVDDGSLFTDTLIRFLAWMKDNNSKTSGSNPNSIFVTSGNWDLQTMLPNQCQLSGIPVPDEMKAWIDIKKSFVESTGVFPRGIIDMLDKLGTNHVGRLHSGIDDCHSIVKIMQLLAERGFIFVGTNKVQQAQQALS